MGEANEKFIKGHEDYLDRLHQITDDINTNRLRPLS